MFEGAEFDGGRWASAGCAGNMLYKTASEGDDVSARADIKTPDRTEAGRGRAHIDQSARADVELGDRALAGIPVLRGGSPDGDLQALRGALTQQSHSAGSGGRRSAVPCGP